MKPRIFIGSSSESRQIAGALQQNLDHMAEVTLWPHDVFQPGEFGLESLLGHLDQAQFAVFVLAGDDKAIVRGRAVKVTRDNVLFELGLFMGRLGRERCFVLAPSPSSASIRIPPDIAGLTRVGFDPNRVDKSLVAATGTAAEQILRAIQRLTSELRPKAAETVHQILEVASRLIALRSGLNENEVRGFLHLYNDDKKCLIPVESYAGQRFHDDAGINIPCNRDKGGGWYIISRAFCDNKFQCSEVDWNSEKAPKSTLVWRDLKSVVAHPVRPQARPNRADTAPIGTIAFDSSKELKALRWKTDRNLEDIVKLLAANVFTVVTRVY